MYLEEKARGEPQGEPDREVDKKALGLYVLLNYDPLEFFDACKEEKSEAVRELLWLMLTTPNPDQTEDNANLNKLGAGLVARMFGKTWP